MEKREDYFCLVLRSIRSALAVGVGCCFLVGYGREGMAADYMDCQDISVINELADADFISSKKVTVGTKRSLADLQITYYNFLQPPGEASSGNKLFVPVRKDANIGGEFLTCNFANDAVFECENSRLWGASGCTRTTKIRETTGGTASVEINDCAKFDNQKLVEGTSTNPNDANELEKLACYPQNHICNKYKEDIFNNYFNVDGLHFTAEATSTGKFFIYKKLAIPEGASRNCNLVKFSCDMKLKNDSPANGKNIVFKNSTYDNNQKFINNVLAGLGDMAFFKLVGLCIKGNAACLDVLNARHYYKYVNGSSIDSQTTIYYFKKNIIYHNIGVLCNKYLPTCQEIEVDGALSNVLYNNSNNGNDFENRRDFYSDHKNKVQEENLWFVNNNNFANYACLAVHGSDANMNKDVGYCSDLNEEKNNLKYPNGLQTMGSISGDGNLISVPNCYLKSCIDLTPEEFLMIVQNGTKTNKYCSEYRWLSNSKGFKYFPKEKPPYCSDLEEVSGKGEQLVFRQYLFQHNGCDSSDVNANGVCRNPRDIYYSYGGGLNKEKDNCYLKNCYSLSGDERSKISEARLTSIGFELERSYALSSVGGVESAYDESKIPIYCDNGFLFMKDTDNFSDFDYLNLNLIPCFELSPEQMMKIASVGSVNMVLFTDIFKNYNTNNVYKFCRTHYIPLDIIDEKHDENTLFLDYVLTIADETARASANGSYSEFFALGGLGQMSVYNGKKMNDVIFAIPVRVASEYRKVSFSHSDLRDFSDRNMYTNVCEYIDNNFLYYNADIKTHDKTKAKDNPKLSAVLENVKRKNGPYAACLNASNASNTKGFIVSDTNIPVVCRNCVTATNQDECLYNNDECKAYAYQYGCRVQHCSGESLKYCEEEDNILNRIVDCGKYKGGPNSYKNYFDCGLYYSTSDNEKKIFKDFETLIGANNISYIQKACDSTLPLEDTRPIISPDTLSKLIKPYKTTASSDGAKNQSLAKTDLERYGCIKFNSPTAGYGLYGCKIPKDDSSYITMSQNPSTAINGMDVDNLDNLKKPKDAKLKLSICSRYPSDVEKDGKCGYREGSAFKDTCVDITDSGEATLEDTSSHCWFFTESSGGSRFRSEQRTKRDILVFRDFHTYHYCYSDISKEFKDGISAAIISGEGALAGTALAAVVCIAPCLATIPFYPVCLGVCSGATILITIGAFMLARIEDWQINLQNDIQIARGYNSVAGYEEKGFISKAFLTDNNNYAYIFYPRYDDIEKDLKSKLENNLSNGQRFFHRNTTGSEIIKKCNISNLFVESNNCNGIDSCDYSYGYNKLKDDGSVEGVCNEGDLEKCLHATQTACLKAYGVSFVKNSGIDDDFLTKSGGFLKHFKDGDITKEDWGTSSNKDNRGYVPVDVIYFTKDKQSVENLKANANCKLGAYGDPVGDLSRCRGFEHEGVFYTESQAAKMPLLTSPFLFYTLITPRNTPELFDPTLIITGYYRFSDLTSERSYNRPDDVILDFFNPKIRYDYSFLGGVNDPDFENLLAYE
ncbi:MAG: hypothetical protein LBB24_00950, partial [Rickettsiales bacterium]|nr:hypothetical protein [Rickettsiales bacterium]